MNYGPKPLIEDHYHIKDLIEGQTKRTEDRIRHQEIEKQRDGILKMIDGFKDKELLDFYCKDCKKDFVGRAKKQIDSWAPIAYYKMKHTCGKWCIRHITERERDPYFYRSRTVAKSRGNSYLDILQPFENGFNLVYGKK